MPLIFSVFAQNEESVLTGLEGEVFELSEYLSGFEKQGLLDYISSYNDALRTIILQLTQHQNELKVFHYSGHSTNDYLDLKGDNLTDDHVVKFFNALNNVTTKVECVFLNGCENEEIVKRLVNIPVVIGTKTPILNTKAIQFTDVFFRALVGGRNTYQEAFNQAASNLPNGDKDVSKVRGAVLRKQDKETPILKDYFIVTNDDKIAAQTFPLNKIVSARSWAKYASLLLTGFIFFLGFFFKDTFIDSWRGYSCPDWAYEEKSNLLIGDFGDGINKGIRKAINANAVLTKYVEPKDFKDFSTYIHDYGKVIPKELPRLCEFECLLTGRVNEIKNYIKIDVYTIDEQMIKEKYPIGELDNLYDSLEVFNPHYQPTYFLGVICLECEEKSNTLLAEAENQTSILKNKPGVELAFQDLSEGIAIKYEKRQNIPKAIEHYGNVADTDINDKALAAREKKAILEEKEGLIIDAYDSRIEYKRSIERRQASASPARYEMKEETYKYEEARQDAMYKAARLVVDHPKKLGAKKAAAIRDLSELQNLNNNQNLYNQEIKQLKGKEEVQPPIEIKVRDEDGKRINHAYAIFDGYTYKINDGVIKIPCPTNNCLGENIRIKASNFKEETTKLKRGAYPMRVILSKKNNTSVQPLVISGQVKDRRGKPLSGVEVILTDKEDVKADKNGKFKISYPTGKLPDNQEVTIRKKGYTSKTTTLKEIQQNPIIQLSRARPEEYSLSGTVKDCNKQPFVLGQWKMSGKDVQMNVDKKTGVYNIKFLAQPGETIKITPPKGFKFSSKSDGNFSVAKNSKLRRNLVVEEDTAKMYPVTGQVFYKKVEMAVKTEPISNVKITPSWKAIATTANKDGAFEIKAPGYLCSKITITAKGYQSITISLKDSYNKENQTISLIKILLIPEPAQ